MLAVITSDEPITSHDPARFEAVKGYLKRSKGYIIVTGLSERAREVVGLK